MKYLCRQTVSCEGAVCFTQRFTQNFIIVHLICVGDTTRYSAYFSIHLKETSIAGDSCVPCGLLSGCRDSMLWQSYLCCTYRSHGFSLSFVILLLLLHLPHGISFWQCFDSINMSPVQPQVKAAVLFHGTSKGISYINPA